MQWRRRSFLAAIAVALTFSATLACAESATDPASEAQDPWAKILESVTFHGGVDSGGGDGFVAEFFSYARMATQIAQPRWDFRNIPFKSLEDLLLSAKVEMVFEILKDGNGVEKDALNFPNGNRIVVSRLRWKELPSEQKLLLTLHEYLGLLRIPDSEFETSQRLLNHVAKSAPAGSVAFSVTESGNCPSVEQIADLRAQLKSVFQMNKQNQEWLKKIADEGSGMTQRLRWMNGERVHLSSDPLPQFEELLASAEPFSTVTGFEALEESLTSRFPPQCKSGVAKAIRLFLPVAQQQAKDARLQLEIWKRSFKTMIKFLETQDLKPPTRTYTRATLVFMSEVTFKEMDDCAHAFFKMDTALLSLVFAFHAAD